MCLVKGVVDCLIGFGCIEKVLFADVVAHKEFVVNHLLRLKSSFINCLFAYLLTENLKTNEVLSEEYQLHLVKDEVDFFLVLHRAVCFDLNFLDLLACLVNFAISLKHFNELLRAYRKLTLDEHLTFGGLSQYS